MRCEAIGPDEIARLEIDEDLPTQRWIWRFERIGWAGLALFVPAGLIEAFGVRRPRAQRRPFDHSTRPAMTRPSKAARSLIARANSTEAQRDRALSAYHLYEYGAAGLQLAIVLASASLIADVAWLTWLGGAHGAAGVAFALLGWLAPTLVHL